MSIWKHCKSIKTEHIRCLIYKGIVEKMVKLTFVCQVFMSWLKKITLRFQGIYIYYFNTSMLIVKRKYAILTWKIKRAIKYFKENLNLKIPQTCLLRNAKVFHLSEFFAWKVQKNSWRCFSPYAKTCLLECATMSSNS